MRSLLRAFSLLAAAQLGAGTLSADRGTWPSVGNDWHALVPPDWATCGATASCALPWDIQSGGGPTRYRSLVRQRFWPPSLPQAGLKQHEARSLIPLLRRLDAGRPITVMAIGSSIVADYVGCWADEAALSAAGVSRVPPAMAMRMVNGSCRAAGYGADLLAAVHSVWPHPHHLLINAGRSSATLNSFAAFICWDAFCPHEGLDLLLLEDEGLADGAGATALLLRDIQAIALRAAESSPRPPAVMLLNTWPLLNTSDTNAEGGGCWVRHGFGKPCRECGARLAAAFAERLGVETGASVEDAAAELVRSHGGTTVSMRDALAAGLQAGLPAALGWSACEWLSAFYVDWIHPSPLGQRFMGDVLVSALLASQQAALSGDDAAPPPLAFDAAGAAVQAPRRCTDADQLVVLRSEGWQYVETETVRNVTLPKPGWAATAADDVLEFEISTRMHRAPAEANVTLVLQFLASYEHMGVARARCVAGCSCDGADVDAHDAAAEHASTQRGAAMAVTQAQRCRVQLAVLAATNSGEHRWKLLGATVEQEGDVNLAKARDLTA